MNKLIALPLLVGACTVMVNGKPRKLGGGSDPAATASTTPAATPSTSTPAPAPTPSQPPPPPAATPRTAAAQVIRVDGAPTTVPIVTRIDGVAFDTTFSKIHGHGNSPDCGSDMTSAPIASIQLDRPVAAMHVAVVGGSNDGFVLRRDRALWFACTDSVGQVPTISKLAEGWQPGRYDIFPISRYAKHASATFSVEIFDPATPAPWSEGVKKLTIAGKLATPMFVDVATKPNRRVLRAEHAGWGCDKVALPSEPDLALVLERPIPGLVVRPLPTATPITLRREHQGDAKRSARGCPTFEQRSLGSTYSPSYHATSELHFDTDDEGTYGLSVGTPDDRPATVTLMIYDASTKLDPLAKFPIADTGSLERRWLGLHFPQLDLRELSVRDYAHLELATKVFASAPATAFVYAKLDLDKDIASGPSDAFPKKNEPLLVLSVDGKGDGARADVLTADGLRYQVKASHVLLATDGEPVPPAAPRAFHKLDIGAVISLLPPSAKPLVTAREKRLEARDKCVDRVWAPYGRQLPTITRPSGVDVVVYESARTKNIRAAGEAAVDRACGTDEASAKLTEAERVKMLAEVDKARAKLLATATAAQR